MDKQQFMRMRLADHFVTAKKVNPLFSLRSFAKKLEIAPSTYSEFQSGKRLLSDRLLRKLCEHLELSENDMKEFEALPLKQNKKIREFSSLADHLTWEDMFETCNNDSFKKIIFDKGTATYYLEANKESLGQLKQLVDAFIIEVSNHLEMQSGGEKMILQWKPDVHPLIQLGELFQATSSPLNSCESEFLS